METFKQAFLAKYPKCNCIFEYFQDATGKNMEWGNLTKLNLSRFVDFLCERIAQNSVRQYCQRIKSVLNTYSDEVDLPKDFAKILTVRGETVVNTWLTDDELDLIVDYIPRNPVEKSVRARFLIAAFTGARFSDAAKLDLSNITDGQVVYVSQKTRVQAAIPLKPILRPILADNKKLENVSAKVFNNTLREICKHQGVNSTTHIFHAGEDVVDEKWKFVTSHTGRRSFATNLYLRGCDLYSISRMMGHSSVEMTAQRYICCPMRHLGDEIMEYFR